MDHDEAHLGWVLLVEDDPDWAELVTNELEKGRYRVVMATSVNEATGKLGRQKFVCVVLDMRLERGTGDQVLAHMRNTQGGMNLHTPVVVVSGFLDPGTVMRIAGQAQAVLVKPFELSVLVSKIRELAG